MRSRPRASVEHPLDTARLVLGFLVPTVVTKTRRLVTCLSSSLPPTGRSPVPSCLIEDPGEGFSVGPGLPSFTRGSRIAAVAPSSIQHPSRASDLRGRGTCCSSGHRSHNAFANGDARAASTIAKSTKKCSTRMYLPPRAGGSSDCSSEIPIEYEDAPSSFVNGLATKQLAGLRTSNALTTTTKELLQELYRPYLFDTSGEDLLACMRDFLTSFPCRTRTRAPQRATVAANPPSIDDAPCFAELLLPSDQQIPINRLVSLVDL
ncbi:uncharacterized protein BO88DRAFT_444126 [Aspergillus vadensis CBS 113365]|uniref:Uncharacterized protein n=1 Tax=Aspergillus vadensis (strain CBS 113365 / IMI 142717 / IBT 24658) TaxID=1448311 RepID=A0A319B985_ASPVC|nr:hypothetical protein BO88DRAFT_444126 [Aspergillus vadensis CBS 113365]PYH68939.1 hypothetical protein BO88DRAFT_444126 [Aspergillus vadensis CBS 113365]